MATVVDEVEIGEAVVEEAVVDGRMAGDVVTVVDVGGAVVVDDGVVIGRCVGGGEAGVVATGTVATVVGVGGRVVGPTPGAG